MIHGRLFVGGMPYKTQSASCPISLRGKRLNHTCEALDPLNHVQRMDEHIKTKKSAHKSYLGNIGVIYIYIYRDNGQENGNYSIILGLKPEGLEPWES